MKRTKANVASGSFFQISKSLRLMRMMPSRKSYSPGSDTRSTSIQAILLPFAFSPIFGRGLSSTGRDISIAAVFLRTDLTDRPNLTPTTSKGVREAATSIKRRSSLKVRRPRVFGLLAISRRPISLRPSGAFGIIARGQLVGRLGLVQENVGLDHRHQTDSKKDADR